MLTKKGCFKPEFAWGGLASDFVRGCSVAELSCQRHGFKMKTGLGGLASADLVRGDPSKLSVARSRWSVYSRDMAGQGRGIARTVALTGASFTCWAELLQSDLIAVFAGGWPQPRAATDVGLTSVAAFGFEAYYFLALGCHQVTGSLFDTGDSCHRGAELAAGSPGPGSAGRSRQDRLFGTVCVILVSQMDFGSDTVVVPRRLLGEILEDGICPLHLRIQIQRLLSAPRRAANVCMRNFNGLSCVACPAQFMHLQLFKRPTIPVLKR
eukprot:symbB.v1.2.016720.t2/scaffold1271.1/size203481/10